nr:hypothetical protein [Tanacetum cinerariifolium]
HWFTHIVLSALRRSDNENTLSLTNLMLRSILTDLQETLKRRWRYLVPAESHIHNRMLIPSYQDIKYQDFRYSDELSNLERYEHVSPMSPDDVMRLCLVDDLKAFNITSNAC